jgi:hypothetical protein
MEKKAGSWVFCWGNVGLHRGVTGKFTRWLELNTPKAEKSAG